MATVVLRVTDRQFTAMAVRDMKIEDEKILLHTIVTDTAGIFDAANAKLERG